MRLFIGASSNEALPKKYVDDCTKLIEIVLKDNDLVFGAYNKGLMGVCYNTAKANNKKVVGLCPEFYRESMNDLECDVEEITTTMLDSTLKIYKNSDVLLFLPGSYGCLYEMFTANYSKICEEIDLPIIIYNSCGFYDKLLEFINDLYDNQLIKEHEKNKYVVFNTIDEVVNYINTLK